MKSSRPQAHRNDVQGSIAEVVITIALALSLSIAFLDVTISMLPAPSGLSSFPFVLALVATTIFIFFLVYIILWFLVVSPLGSFFNLQAIPLAASLALVLGISFLLALLAGLIGFPRTLDDLFKQLLLFSVSLLTSVAAYLASKARTSGYRNVVMILSLATPFVLAETTAFVWLHKYRLGPFFSLPSLLVTAGYVLIASFTVGLVWRVGLRIRIARWLAVFMALVALSSIVTLVNAKDWNGGSESFKETDHQIKHVILITVDTLRADALSAYGPLGVSTPHIDGLARDGIFFRKATSASPWTLPSIPSIMTGLSPMVHMMTKRTSRLPDSVTTLAEYMRDAGYITAAIGSNPYLAHPRFNVSQGFLRYVFFPKYIGSSFGGRILRGLFPDKLDPSTHALTKLAMDWLESNREKNFFLWIHIFDPHHPYAPPADFLPQKEPPPRIGTVFSIRHQAIRGGVLVPSLAEREWIKALYESEVRYVSENIGELLEILKQLNLYDESLIILTSDHGEEFWDHGSYEHGHTLYNEVLWVPLIIKLPLSAFRKEITTAVATPSLMPTILDLCKIGYERDLLSFGSLVPLWGPNPGTFEARPIISTALGYFEDRESVIFAGLKYIRSFVTNREELYNLDRDPTEQLSILHSLPDRVEQARTILEAHSEMARRLREIHGTNVKEQFKLDEELIQRLKTLGYVQ